MAGAARVLMRSIACSRSETISLELYAKADVWMEIIRDGKRIFRGTLNKGQTKKLEAEKDFSLWLGKTEAVELTVNGKRFPLVAKGVQKNILITSVFIIYNWHRVQLQKTAEQFGGRRT